MHLSWRRTNGGLKPASAISQQWPALVDKGPLTFADFQKVDIRAGTIMRAEPFIQARQPAYKIWLDLGPEIGERKASAQVTVNYRPEELLGRQVAVVVNFPPKQIGRFMSEALILGFPEKDDRVVLISPDKKVANGARLF